MKSRAESGLRAAAAAERHSEFFAVVEEVLFGVAL